MRKNDYCSVGGSELSKLVKESKTLERQPWIDKNLAKKAIEASRRRARGKMKISIETNINKLATPTLDRMLTRIASMLEKDTGLKFEIKADGHIVRRAHKAKLLRKKASQAESVVYDATESGWVLNVLDAAGQTIEEQSGGSHQDKPGSIAPDNGGLSYESNLSLAKNAAGAKAAELGLDPRYVSHQQGLLDAERALPSMFYDSK